MKTAQKKRTTRNKTRRTTQKKIPAGLRTKDLLELYERMLLLRRFEETAQEFYRSGRWPGFIHLYIGEEATAVGVCAALRENDQITSTHRGHGHALAKGVPPGVVMAELLGKTTGCSGGRGGSMHMFSPSVGLLGSTGIVGSGIPLAVGAALGAKARGTDQVAAAFFGDGATNHAAFLESINFATVQKLPVIFVCENNLYATQTALWKATANTRISSKSAAFGCKGVTVDGNDVLAVLNATKQAVSRARKGKGPTLIESLTYRWCGHHEGDPPFGDYRTEEELNEWKERCPIASFRKFLTKEPGIVSSQKLTAIHRRVEKQIEDSIDFAESSPDPDPATVHDHVYAEPINPPMPEAASESDTVEQGWLQAVCDAMLEEMRENPNIIVLGEGIAERGGCFGHVKDLWKEFGDNRVIDTPICELAFTGAAAGASATGCRAIADLMFADFMFDAGTQIVQQAAKLRYMSNGQVGVPMIVRAPMGMIKNAGAHHSGAYYPVWGHIPGLIVAVPSTPAEAKGLMKTALRASDPVIFLEHKGLFSMKGEVPKGEYLVPFGKARVVRQGTDLTIVTCGLLLHRCLEAAERLEEMRISCDVIDLRTIVPLDVDTLAMSLRITGKLLVVDEAWSMFGLGAEIAAAMMEHGFDYLDAPVARLHTERVSFPFSPCLDDFVSVTVEKIVTASQNLLVGSAPTPVHPKADREQGEPEWVPVPPPRRRPRHTAPRPAQSPKPPAPPVSPVPPVSPAPSKPAPAPEPCAPGKDGGGVPVIMPNMDLTIEEATVVRWVKQVGDHVKKGECVLEVETDKAIVEIEAPASGTLSQLLVQKDDVVALGAQLGVIEPD